MLVSESLLNVYISIINCIYAFIHVVQVCQNFIAFSAGLKENFLSEAQERETNHDSHTDVPKFIISSNCIRLLDVVGQGTLTMITFDLLAITYHMV